MIKLIFVFIFYACLGSVFEGVYNSIFTKPHNKRINKIMNSPKGHFMFTSVYVLPVYGLGGLMSYLIYSVTHLWYYTPVFILIVFFNLIYLEFFFGSLYNIVLELNIWTYENERFNLDDQICLKSVIGWFFMSIVLYGINYLIKGL